MDPITLGVLSLATTAVSTGVGIIGAVQQGNAQADAARYQAQVAENNQKIAQQNAAYAAQAGAVKAAGESMRTKALVGQEAAAQGASGIDLTTGSPYEVRRGTEQIGRLGALTSYNNDLLTAYGYKTQASNFGAEAGLDRARASSASSAAGIGAFSSLIGGASNFADKWSSYKLRGVF